MKNKPTLQDLDNLFSCADPTPEELKHEYLRQKKELKQEVKKLIEKKSKKDNGKRL